MIYKKYIYKKNIIYMIKKFNINFKLYQSPDNYYGDILSLTCK